MLDVGGLFWMYVLATALVVVTVPLVGVLTRQQPVTVPSPSS